MTIKSKLCNAQNYQTATRSTAQIRYIVIHYTGNQGDTAAANASYFAREAIGTSAHYFVDAHEIWQSVPDQCIAWHCGCKTGYFHAHCRNANSIGIEICMLDKNGAIRQGSMIHAAALTRCLMQRYKISPENIVRHYDVTHKNCPAPMVVDARLWREFLDRLTDQQEDKMTQAQFDEMMEQWLQKHDPLYSKLAEMPAYLQTEAQELIHAGALKGDSKGLAVRHGQLRDMIISKRYTDYRVQASD